MFPLSARWGQLPFSPNASHPQVEAPLEQKKHRALSHQMASNKAIWNHELLGISQLVGDISTKLERSKQNLCLTFIYCNMIAYDCSKLFWPNPGHGIPPSSKAMVGNESLSRLFCFATRNQGLRPSGMVFLERFRHRFCGQLSLSSTLLMVEILLHSVGGLAPKHIYLKLLSKRHSALGPFFPWKHLSPGFPLYGSSGIRPVFFPRPWGGWEGPSKDYG